jgi:hypothetical protein
MKFSIGRSTIAGLLFLTILSPGWAPGQQMSVSTPSQEVQGSGELRFKETSFDFGTVYQGVEVVHEYPLQNAGSKPLVITKVATR